MASGSGVRSGQERVVDKLIERNLFIPAYLAGIHEGSHPSGFSYHQDPADPHGPPVMATPPNTVLSGTPPRAHRYQGAVRLPPEGSGLHSQLNDKIQAG